MNDLTLLNLFLSILSAFIVKDFYDILLSTHIRNFFKKYKLIITRKDDEK